MRRLLGWWQVHEAFRFNMYIGLFACAIFASIFVPLLMFAPSRSDHGRDEVEKHIENLGIDYWDIECADDESIHVIHCTVLAGDGSRLSVCAQAYNSDGDLLRLRCESYQ